MIYEVDGMKLEVVGEIFRGSVNSVVVCKDLNSSVTAQYTVLSIHDSETIKKALRIFAEDERCSEQPPYLMRFSQNEELCFLFPYRPERKLFAFAAGQTDSVNAREEIAVAIVMECLSTTFPYPFLYLIIKQKNIHLNQDNSVYFTPHFDLSELDEEKDEAACVSRCAGVLLGILESRQRGKKRSVSHDLIRKKRAKKGYTSFPELYRDIRLTASSSEKPKLKSKLKAFWKNNKDIVFRLLLIFCGILMIAAGVLLISQLIFGDIPLLRLVGNPFKEIGTEDLIKR